MYSVIVADDEPVALDNICTLLKTQYADFAVLETAGDGAQALKLVSELRPDVLITDIRMPVMDGITLIKKVREINPNIIQVLISGYQDFCYAQDAIRAEVSDYILKPVVPSDFRNTMRVVRAKLQKLLCARRARLLRSIYGGETPDAAELAACFPEESYYLLLERKNSLPCRFEFSGSEFELTSLPDESVVMYGRDEREALCLYPASALSKEGVLRLASDFAFDPEANAEGYATAAVCPSPVNRAMLPDVIPALYRLLGTQSIIGKSQVLQLSSSPNDFSEAPAYSADSSDTLLKMLFLVKENKFEAAKKELHRLLALWQGENKTQLWLERQIRQIIYVAESSQNAAAREESEFLLEDAFYYAASVETLEESIAYILSKFMRAENDPAQLDTPELFAKIEDYIRANLAEPLNMQLVCKKFGVCQPNLSKMFRCYENQSFNNYLTSLRIEKSKRLLREDKNTLIKDVAALCGYSDPFYFSRLFRSVVGVSPTEYAK